MSVTKDSASVLGCYAGVGGVSNIVSSSIFVLTLCLDIGL